MIYVNVAPRGENTGHSATFLDENVSCKEPVKAKKWPNGTPFGYFYHGQTLVVASIDGYTLSLLKKFNITNKINVMDIPTVMDYAISKDMFPADMRDFVVLSQFRSNDFVPRACYWLHKGIDLPYEELSFDKVLDAPKTIWFIDIFGNCKTTLLPKDIDFEVGKKISLSFGEATMYNRLKDVPNGELAVTIGSSGYHKDRFLEIVIQGKSVAKKFNISSGQSIF